MSKHLKPLCLTTHKIGRLERQRESNIWDGGHVEFHKNFECPDRRLRAKEKEPKKRKAAKSATCNLAGLLKVSLNNACIGSECIYGQRCIATEDTVGLLALYLSLSASNTISSSVMTNPVSPRTKTSHTRFMYTKCIVNAPFCNCWVLDRLLKLETLACKLVLDLCQIGIVTTLIASCFPLEQATHNLVLAVVLVVLVYAGR